MTWIKTIAAAQAKGRLAKIYQQLGSPKRPIDNILTAQSLRPHMLEGHLALYKSVLHHNENELPPWYREVIGVFVSLINDCQYCVTHHFTGLTLLLKDEEKSSKIKQVLEQNKPEEYFKDWQLAGLKYAALLTNKPGKITADFFQQCLNAGLDDGRMLEINQIAAYFNYANRTVLGLGITLETTEVGLPFE